MVSRKELESMLGLIAEGNDVSAWEKFSFSSSIGYSDLEEQEEELEEALRTLKERESFLWHGAEKMFKDQELSYSHVLICTKLLKKWIDKEERG